MFFLNHGSNKSKLFYFYLGYGLNHSLRHSMCKAPRYRIEVVGVRRSQKEEHLEVMIEVLERNAYEALEQKRDADCNSALNQIKILQALLGKK